MPRVCCLSVCCLSAQSLIDKIKQHHPGLQLDAGAGQAAPSAAPSSRKRARGGGSRSEEDENSRPSSPPSAAAAEDTWLTGVFRLPFELMLELERERYPQLAVRRSQVGGDAAGLGVFAMRRLEPDEFVCCVLGRLRLEGAGTGEVKSHPLALDHPELDDKLRGSSYSLRMYRGTMASLVNSGRSPAQHGSDRSNVDIVYHPHFLRYPDRYQSLRVIPSGAMWIRCKTGRQGIEKGEELLAGYEWWKMPVHESRL